MAPRSLAASRSDYVQRLDRELSRIVEQLAAMDEVRRVILFGSYATGRRDLFTDLDLLVVLVSTQDFITRTAELTRALGAQVDLDLLVYTPEEFSSLEESGFLRHILQTGKVLYEKNTP
jgi:predicted nucleotidyltransferase